MARPITQKAKSSPFKQTGEPVKGAGEIILTDTEIVPGKTTTKTVSEPGKVTGSYKNKMSNEAWKQYLANETPEQKAKRYAREEKDGVRAAATEKTVTVKEPDTEVKIEKPIYAEDKTDAITPWENRWNKRVMKQDERFQRKEARRDLARSAREVARKARQDEGQTFGQSIKTGLDVFRGKNLSEGDQKLYNTMRGVSDQQREIVSTDRSKRQFEQGASGDDQVIQKRLADQTDLLNAEVGAQRRELGGDLEAVAKMRYDKNVGIKQSTPLKKGYFKGK
jgi:hypothetical protein